VPLRQQRADLLLGYLARRFAPRDRLPRLDLGVNLHDPLGNVAAEHVGQCQLAHHR
jgi:hypothetical protein